jgi:hypothetical protein
MRTNPPTQSAQTTPAPQQQMTTPAPQAQAQATPSPQTQAPAQPATYTDAQLRSFATAATQIQPLQAQLASATVEQRTALVTQIRAILAQNNLDGATYNAIAAQAQADPAFAARITALNTTPAPG